MCVKIIQQLTSETCQGYFFGTEFSFRFLHRHSGFASGHCNGTVAIEFHPKIEKITFMYQHHQMSNIAEKTNKRPINLQFVVI